jgi:hypothetical protein
MIRRIASPLLKQTGCEKRVEREIDARNRLKVCGISLEEQILKKVYVYPDSLNRFPFGG